jgi:uncharacterized protein DUF1203
MSESDFLIVPMDSKVADDLRQALTDEMGNALTERRDDERHQCRCCLRLTLPGEPYLAVSYAPMRGRHAFVERGPVYIHARACEPYADTRRYPEEFPRQAVVLRAYNDRNEIEDARFVGRSGPEAVIRELFANPAVRRLHARNSTYGCFMFGVEREL